MKDGLLIREQILYGIEFGNLTPVENQNLEEKRTVRKFI